MWRFSFLLFLLALACSSPTLAEEQSTEVWNVDTCSREVQQFAKSYTPEINIRQACRQDILFQEIPPRVRPVLIYLEMERFNRAVNCGFERDASHPSLECGYLSFLPTPPIE